MSAGPARRGSRAVEALGWSFAVTAHDQRFVDHVDALYRGLPDAPPAGAVHAYVVTAREPRVHQLLLDGEHVAEDDDVSTLLVHLVHDVNRRAIDSTSLLVAHAGGVVGARGAVVLPAHAEAGKTTLTTGLVGAGFGYLSDEAVAFDFDTLEITAYAKPLSIDPGAWDLFARLEPDEPFDGEGYKTEQWQVPPERVRRGAVVARARARYLVFPRYRDGAATTLEPISRAEGVVELAKNTFHFRRHGRRGLDALARLVPELDCYRLEVGDLDRGIAVVTELAGAPA